MDKQLFQNTHVFSENDIYMYYKIQKLIPLSLAFSAVPVDLTGGAFGRCGGGGLAGGPVGRCGGFGRDPG